MWILNQTFERIFSIKSFGHALLKCYLKSIFFIGPSLSLNFIKENRYKRFMDADGA